MPRFAIRFALIYVLLYCSFGLPLIPLIGRVLAFVVALGWKAIASSLAIHVFHISGPAARFHFAGSGDALLDYLQVLCFAVVAAVGALIWSIVDPGEQRVRIVSPWIRLIARPYLASHLVLYGLGKVVPLQFPPPDYVRLTETFGEASPMGLLWAFMGSSRAYEMFSGWAELIPGMLLLFRRTSTAGALLAACVMTNVVALNFCFDVPVKLFSSHLLLLALFLLVPDIQALWGFFVRRRVSKLDDLWIPRFERKPLRIGTALGEALVIAGILLGALQATAAGYSSARRSMNENAALGGVWNVDQQASTASSSPWKRIMIPPFGRVGVRNTEGELLRFMLDLDAKSRKMRFTGWRNDHSASLSFEQPDHDHLLLRGTLDGTPLQLPLHRLLPQQFLLTQRGFHWISEDPYNL